MEATKAGDNKTSELQAKLEDAVEEAKSVCKRLDEKIVEAAKITDKAIREHPYHSAGIAFGAGLLIGVLATWCRKD